MYRIGKKQKRVILTENGNEVVVFQKGKEALAQKVCDLLNADLEVNKISSNGMLAVTSDSKENKKESEVAVCEHKEWMNVDDVYEQCGECGNVRKR
jgi:hypothetical protein